MASKVQKELESRFSKVKPGRNRQDYLLKIIDKIEALTEDQWEELSGETQDWYNEALPARDKSKTIPEMPGVEAEEEDAEEERPAKTAKGKKTAAVEEDEEADAEVEEEEERPAAKKKKAKVEEEEEEEERPAAKKKKAAKTDEEEEERPTRKSAKETTKPKEAKQPRLIGGVLPKGAPTVIRTLISKNPNLSKAELMEKLEAKGIKVSATAVNTARSDHRLSIRVLQHLGLLTKTLIA